MVTGQWTLRAPKHSVWKLIVNPEHLVQNIPNVVSSDFESDRIFRFVVDVDTGLGFAQYRFNTVLDVIEPSESLVVRARGFSSQNVVEIEAKVTLTAVEEQETTVEYVIATKARGGLASVAQRTVSEVAVRHVTAWLKGALEVSSGSPV
ncbi:SRPBCC domain-containing protein [Alicyclobacillus sp. SO9]|uniref:SRPBCC domain-containing protein n=1 Tax=Alicyclobacillus sp. SO9 TaxID=2665646 RepID=UPI0018E83158|nr:SRPBCC domain-containing protein [Alicyclobacillus sp. SO9]QQE80503.1 SRPBCC domain-containing protein [Alicyclobacillus sp. SO9]